MSEEIICLENVELWRRNREQFHYDFKRAVFSLVQGRRLKIEKKLVLKNINLRVNQGEKIGIIGANGAGKSTLLKVICGILPPSRGTVRVRGKIAPLIELGAGFDPEMSVRDNIILYGVLLGHSRQEMKRRLKDIISFAELEEYTHLPVKALSSGMRARLGFAIATDVKPDILIVDEVLSVGDAHFAQKSRRRMEDLWQRNTTILFVSHSLAQVEQLCPKSIWLNHGEIAFMGDTGEAIQRYLEYIGLNASQKNGLC
ncbi:MAG: ABC transporter ATP-binding protein [Geminocystis sp.]|nr:ABC transporter ATP-binding protein [Geminocystis sp.]HIK37653.1 ABC transporter ATP-binding protein [Geminocystis sp. M7585_C2015_104]MCS7147570.1 ABC transporter ATP-binding protein [Geminocystis sp.]MCX8077973.1 ABC transporter ATP-binding protein [Geminocystis sp.]MDW8115263.1 ABC transporter ATP-binding protein [Geminocystis sp.]